MMDLLKRDVLVLSGKKNIKRWDYFSNTNKLKDYVKFNAHRRNIYSSVNDYKNKVKQENIIFKWLFIDFDENPYNNCSKVLSFCLSEKLAFYLAFSGKGYHIYLKVEPALEYSHNLSRKIGVFINDLMNKTGAICDYKVSKDLNRVSRIPNTINTKTNLYCIPLTIDEFVQCKHKGIQKLAKKPRKTDYIFHDGGGVDIGSIEVPKTETLIYDEGHTIYSYRKAYDLPPCLQNILKKKNLGYFERFLLILYYRDLGYSIKETEDFLKESLTEDKFNHCIFEENQVAYLYKREDLLFPSCETLKIEQICVGNCRGNSLYI